MSFTICAVVLYGHHGQKRILPFRTHGLSIVTGNSKTGKSAIIDIVDYCLGRGSYNVAEGEIRRKVSWFGLHLSKEGDEVFVARDNPGPGASTGSRVYIQRGRVEKYPDVEDIAKNTTATSLSTFMTQYAGIVENVHRPSSGTRPPLSANIKHAVWLCFQPQGTVATKDQLFHRMNEQHLPQALKDTFPYFVGAVDEEHFRHLAELDELTVKLRLLEAQEAKRRQAIELSRGRVVRMVNEGKRLGLIPQEYQAVDDSVFEFLATVSETQVDDPVIVQDFGETIRNLRDEQSTLQGRLFDLNQDVRAARTFLSSQTDFTREGGEQATRLRSIGLYSESDDGHAACPLCEAALEAPVPSVREVVESLGKVEGLLAAAHRESPHIQEYINGLVGDIERLTGDLREVQRELANAVAEDESARLAQNQLVARAAYLGKLADFLEVVKPDEDSAEAAEEIDELRLLIEGVRQRLNSDETVSRMETFLNFISQRMTEYSKELELEHSGSALRLDMKRLTVVADTEDGPIPLNRMGSGENWVSYHVLAHLALHWWFRRRHRPVPGILILDQPTQAYYPPDRVEGGLDQIEKDADRRAVQALFRLMYKACEDILKPFQLIVMDHAHLDDDWFEECIVEEWRGENALVPLAWPVRSDA